MHGDTISFTNRLLVALSAADTNKWSTLLEKPHQTSKSEAKPVDYERTGPILQRQRRLCKQVIGDDLYLDVLNSF